VVEADAVGVSHETVRRDADGTNVPVDEDEQEHDPAEGGTFVPSTAAEALQAAKEIKSQRRQKRDEERTERRAYFFGAHPVWRQPVRSCLAFVVSRSAPLRSRRQT